MLQRLFLNSVCSSIRAGAKFNVFTRLKVSSPSLLCNTVPLFNRVSSLRSFMTSSKLFAVEGFTAPPLRSSALESTDDCIVVVGNDINAFSAGDKELHEALRKVAEINRNIEKEVSVIRIDRAPHRLVYSPTGPLNRDYDDIRRVYEAANKGIQKALQIGSKRPHVRVSVPDNFFGKSTPLMACLGAMNPFYVDVLTRERIPDRRTKAESIGFHFDSLPLASDSFLDLAAKLDAARWVTRDIGGTDPETFTPAKIASYVQNLFPTGSPVKLEVISGQDEFEKRYPLFAAVNRGVADVPKHSGRIIWLEYTGEGAVEQSLYLVGKGVVYDTGGHDLKTDGHMAGMHRDKCGAAAVAGFFKFLHDTRPRGLHVVGALALVRNEIGPQAYVADEIITARSGVRVAITNTDAEGRMAMTDLLCEAKDRALTRVGVDPKPPQLFTIATLTGHALIAFGEGYGAIMENGPARKLSVARKLQAAGDALGDIFERSSLRREDFEQQRCKNEYADVIQTAGNGPSTRCPRGHQCPGAFLVIASGLEQHGNDSSKPLAYSHLDIAGAVGYWMSVDPPNPSALMSLIGAYVMPRLPNGVNVISGDC